jgi:hypothetical protein
MLAEMCHQAKGHSIFNSAYLSVTEFQKVLMINPNVYWDFLTQNSADHLSEKEIWFLESLELKGNLVLRESTSSLRRKVLLR